MGQPEFDNFKQQIKEWMNSHPEEYNSFVEEMNQKDNVGYGKILCVASLFYKKYETSIRKNLNEGNIGDVSEIENNFIHSKLAHYLVNSVQYPRDHPLVMPMLAWLYYGKAFERMVEKGLEFKKNDRLPYVYKFYIDSVIKYAVSKSISLGLRTKSDWEEHSRLIHSADEDRFLETIPSPVVNNITIHNNYCLLTNKEDVSQTNKEDPNKDKAEKNKAGRPSTKNSKLVELFREKVNQHEFLCTY